MPRERALCLFIAFVTLWVGTASEHPSEKCNVTGDVAKELSAAELSTRNEYFFNGFAHLGIHREMIGDAARTGAYLAAIDGHAVGTHHMSCAGCISVFARRRVMRLCATNYHCAAIAVGVSEGQGGA
jgi:hypothetical protein